MAPTRRQTRGRKAAATKKKAEPMASEAVEPQQPSPVEETPSIEIKNQEVVNEPPAQPVRNDHIASINVDECTTDTDDESSSNSSSSCPSVDENDDDVKIIDSPPYVEPTVNADSIAQPDSINSHTQPTIPPINDASSNASVALTHSTESSTSATNATATVATVTTVTATSTAPRSNAKKATVAAEDYEVTRMFLKPIPAETTAEDIREYFIEKGFTVTDTYVPMKRGQSQGYGFVSFSTAEQCNEALKLKSIVFKGCRTVVATATGKAFSRTDDPKSNVLFLRNLPKTCSSNTLKHHFKDSSDIRLMRSDAGDCRGIAFVEFPSYRLAQEAKRSVGDLTIDGRIIIVEFGRPKGEITNEHSSYDMRKSYDSRPSYDTRSSYDNRLSYNSGSSYDNRPYYDGRPSYVGNGYRRTYSPPPMNNHDRLASRSYRDHQPLNYSRSTAPPNNTRSYINDHPYRKPPSDCVLPPRYPRDYHADRYYERDSSYYQPPPPPHSSNSYHYDRREEYGYSTSSALPTTRAYQNPNYYNNNGNGEYSRRSTYDREPDDYRRYRR